MEKIVLAGGCFWCTEAVFQRLKGVAKVTPGYSGGEMENPSYDDVSSGETGHAEVIEIEFEPKTISLEEILKVFFATHDPTTLNRQGADVGTQYRSVIFYSSEAQKQMAENLIRKIQENYSDPIVTKLEAFKKFYPAENYHRDYYNAHKDAPYCQVVIDPKIQKLTKEFKDDLK